VSLRLRAAVPERGVELELAVPEGRTLALLGPNGSGKSTLLSVLAGLLVPDAGEAVLGERTLLQVEAGRGVRQWVPAHRRRVALLAQEPLLFPHLDVLGNVAFGPRSAGLPRREAEAIARRCLATVDTADLADRPARALSGGQAQRVALARALATDPELLLLDEPLASLDVDVAGAVRQTLGRVLAGRTAIVVTHDVLDVALLADEVAVLADGRVVERGPVAGVLRTPRSAFAASLFGLNMLTGSAVGPDALRTAGGWVVHGQADTALVPGEPAIAVFRPAAVSVHRVVPSGSPRNILAGPIESLAPQGHLVRVGTGEVRADITPAAVAELALRVGEPVHLAVKAAEVALYPAARGAARPLEEA
jgi:molybdate transport system ATP-binding protein